jgi:hypothetical protein
MGAPAKVSPRLVSLYQRAQICQTFPAYRLEELKTLPAVEILQAMEMLSLVRQAQQAG